MAASLEARVPLLDHRLVEFAASLPDNLKLHGWRRTRKYLLREVARDLLPAPILSRSKKGFPVPISEWLRGEARQYCHDLLAPETVRRRGLFDPASVGRLIAQHDSGAADHGSMLWGLLSVEMWHRRFIDAA
jgi:asparagine synthase (glutamine-hydrolysing)